MNIGSHYNYEVLIHRRVAKFLGKLPRNIVKQVLSVLNEFKEDPFKGDVKAIRGYVNLFRRRVGKIRIIYYVDFEKRKVVVVKVDFRGKAYKGL